MASSLSTSNINGIMNNYNQHRSSSIPKRPNGRPRQRSTSVPYTQVRAPKGKVVQTIRKKKVPNSSKHLPQSFSYKEFEEIWERNVEYTDQTSEKDILKYVCNAFNSQSSENVAEVNGIKPSWYKTITA
ncbi:Hypothetical predicted protein [Paramuricea clavata]|uniref:Uncharacterized protein n=1 Tax=Paramuricea clavata TaxID=317549 RepID=A0A7D9J3K7_PARCT|nr:Hypothetical predicted protein [Paramuricea clavata]